MADTRQDEIVECADGLRDLVVRLNLATAKAEEQGIHVAYQVRERSTFGRKFERQILDIDILKVL